MRLIGILLIMQAVRGYTDPFAAHDQVTSTLLTIAGRVNRLYFQERLYGTSNQKECESHVNTQG